MAFKHCEKCPKDKKRKSLCEKFRTCLDEKSADKKGDKKPVKEGTYG
jgi:hypothetical protein